jgi:hypothetical protein
MGKVYIGIATEIIGGRLCHQVYIHDGDGGYRIAGVKMINSKEILRRELTERDISETRRYLNKASRQLRREAGRVKGGG